MKKAISMLLVSVFCLFVLASCGQKSQEQVKGDLQKKLEHLTGYKAEAVMTLYTGKKTNTYGVEIWYKKPDQYRIQLKNAKQYLSQIILKNKKGVFVLTPQLDKSYHFQSDWPKNGSQWYLYESLIKDILNDTNPTFTSDSDHYIFKTKTNYRHGELRSQKITLSKKNLKPLSVQVMGKDQHVLVDMKFKKVTFDSDFDDNAFELGKNMTSAKLQVPAVAHTSPESFQVYYPLTLPKGTQLSSRHEVKTDHGKEYVFQYTGDHSFTLMEQKSKAAENGEQPVIAMGHPMNLDFTIARMSDHSISWVYDGTDFFLASKDLSQKQLVDVARSVLGKQGK